MSQLWRGGRVVEGTCLENRRAGNRTEGSNPSLSASSKLFSELPSAWAAFSLAARSASQMFSGGKWELGRGWSRAFLVVRHRRISGKIRVDTS